ncbi:MAG: hypothetical protein KF898_05955 [Parachlamydiales bacterium]|nr:hypothetical protein [Candidatus Acheromyda pituitae]
MSKDLFRNLLPIALCAIGSLWADADQDLNSRVTILESQMSEVSMKSPFGNFGAKTASASPLINGYDVFVSADFLYWNLQEGGTDYAYSSPNTTSIFPLKGKRKHLEFDWDPGFRTGLGFVFDHDRWDAYFNFTWFQTSHRASAEERSDRRLFSLLAPYPSGLQSAKLSWKVHFYTLDFELGRHFFVSRFLSLRPFFGLKGAWIDQHRHTRYTDRIDSDIFIKTRGRCEFRGIGPWAGINGDWHFCRNFSFFGRVAGSIMWGDFDVHEKQTGNNHTLWFDYDLDKDRIVPMVQFQLGFCWETNLGHDRYHLAFNLSYEDQYWWQQNQFPYYPGTNIPKLNPINEDLSLQGLTFDVRLDF